MRQSVGLQLVVCSVSVAKEWIGTYEVTLGIHVC